MSEFTRHLFPDFNYLTKSNFKIYIYPLQNALKLP